MYGVGYPVLEAGIRGHYSGGFLMVLLVGKLVAVSLTIAIGGSGGVFAPSLFIGAMFGTGYGQLVHGLFPGSTANPGAYGLVGMGAVFAAAARAPITAVIIIFELTGDYAIILPLMFAVVLSSGLSTLLSRDSIYTLKLRRRGIEIMRGRSANLMQLLRVSDAMDAVPEGVSPDTPLDQLIERLVRDRRESVPVFGDDGRFHGVVQLAEVEAAMRDNALDASAKDLAREVTAARPEQTLEAVLGLLAQSDGAGVPVMDTGGEHVIGWLTHRDMLQAYSRRVADSVSRAQGDGASGRASVLPGLRGYRVVDLVLEQAGAPVGCMVREVPWPPSSLLLAIKHGEEVVVPDGSARLEKGDRLTVLVPAADADRLADILTAPRAASDA